MYFVYVIKSIKKGTLYIGFTKRLDQRIKEHNSGYNSSTKHAKPFKLVYFESVSSLDEALKLEKLFKSGYRREILKNIASGNYAGEVPKWLKGTVC